MTASQPPARTENVLGGFLLALLAVPVGVVLIALLSSIGFVASIVGFVVAFCAVWLYRRGSGGFLSRAGAWVITCVVLVTLLLGIWVDLVVVAVGGFSHLNDLGANEFWPAFNAALPKLIGQDVLFIVLILAFGALGAFRTIGRAFAVARANARPTPMGSGSATIAGSPTSTTTEYHNDVDTPPTGSADDRTPPPSVGG